MLHIFAKTGLALAFFMTSFAGPASAAVSREVRAACEKKADEVRPALRAPEREAFIANCLADATVDQGKK